MNQELTNLEKIQSLLLSYGIHKQIEIEKDAEGMILAALNQDNIHDVHIDNEGALVIEYDEYE